MCARIQKFPSFLTYIKKLPFLLIMSRSIELGRRASSKQDIISVVSLPCLDPIIIFFS